MKIAVLIKQVPDTETKIRIKEDGSGIEEGDIKYIVSPYDEFAIEEAIKTAEAVPGSETVVVSLGPERAVEAIRTALAMGVQKAVHIDDEGAGFDSFVTAKVLAKVLDEQKPDVIFCGKQAIDGDSGQVTQMIAEFLDVCQVMIAESFALNDDKASATVTRRVSGGAKEVYDVAFPLIIGCEKGINTPRYASLPGIMKAKTKPVEKLKSSDLLDGASAKVTYANFQLPPERAAGKTIEGEPADQAKELVRLLREEAKAV